MGVASSAWRRRFAVTGLFAALAAVMTWPQARFFSTHALEHQDVYFNLWRLRWIAHVLLSSPANFFNGNQFYPERGVLAYSDALLVEGLIGAPLLWAGVPPVFVHNLLLVGAIVASGAGLYALARHVTGSTAGAVIAGIVFAFAPYRFDHYMHMELQWTVWSPWAFWAVQRTFETRATKYGVLTGIFLTLQMMSSVYYGVFLALLVAVVCGVQLLVVARPILVRTVAVLALGAIIAGGLSFAYSRPYAAASARVGVRGEHEISTFSARPRDYRVTTPDNKLYASRYGLPERRLFPGLLPMVLALAGLLLAAPTPAMVAYVVALVTAFEMSLGMNGMLYPFLREHVAIFDGLRAPARAAVYVLLFLGILAARGFALIADALPPRRRAALGAIGCAVLLGEYWVAPMPLIPFDNTAPPLYAFLARQPPGVVAEFPMPQPSALPGDEARYIYMSTFHWLPLLNGYSGYYPPGYLKRLTPLREFPKASALQLLRRSDVRYVVVHAGGYQPEERTRLVEELLKDPLVVHLGDFEDGSGGGALFRLQ